jgi:hypothetical protein
MAKEITRIKSGDPSNPWPYLVQCQSQENPEVEIAAAREALGISANDLTVGSEYTSHASGSGAYYGSIVAKRKDDLQRLCEQLLSRGWTIREEHLWTLRRHSPSWGSKPPQ